MMVASWEGHLGIVESLLSADADPNLKEGVSYFNFKLCNSRLQSQNTPGIM